ncbi:MAG: tRNA lysidine(34) synthetase TilS [candidate division KSB1 bacterium]
MPQEKDKLLDRFRRHVQAQALIQRGDSLLLAVSGGVDSRVLLDLFAHLQAAWDLQLRVGHVQHQLRGMEAEQDAEFAAELAQHYGMPGYNKSIAVQSFAQEKKLSLETAGRELRYKALAEICQERGAAAIVTAHTQDDQAETILAHVLRGSGLRGLRGMAARTVIPHIPFPVLRPLLPFSRAEILRYAQEQRLAWREDKSNADVRFQRNRVRHELLPLLRERFNPQINQALTRLGRVAREGEEYLQHATGQALQETIIGAATGKIILDLQRFWNYFRGVQAYVIRAVMERVSPSATTLTFDETEQILSFLNPTHNQPFAFARRRHLWRSEVEIFSEKAGIVFSKIQPTPEAKFLDMGQRCLLPEIGVAITVAALARSTTWRERSHAALQFADGATTHGKLRVRFPQAGDRFMPLGMRGFKKLSDFFIDAKVPRAQRGRVPLLECETGIVWVCGYRLDERFKITPHTERMLQLQLENVP